MGNPPSDRQGPVNEMNNPENGEAAQIIGVAISNDNVERLKQFRASFLPDARIAAQETYAKWLFGLTTTIAALGTGFSNTAFAKLSSFGVVIYSLAVIAAGVGLVFSVWTLSEEVKDANWNDYKTMNARLTDLMRRKGKLLRWATIFFSASLVFAAASPFATAIQLRPAVPSRGIVMSISGRAVEAGISLAGLRPGARAELDIYKNASRKSELVAAFLQIADDSGKLQFKASKFPVSPEQQELKAILRYSRGGDPQSEEEAFSIPQASAEATTEVNNTAKEPLKPPLFNNDGHPPRKSKASSVPCPAQKKCCCCDSSACHCRTCICC